MKKECVFSLLLIFLLGSVELSAQKNAHADSIIQQEVQKMTDQRWHTGVVMVAGNEVAHYAGGAGDISPNTPYFIASATKLFVVTLFLQLADEQKLRLDDPIGKYISPELLQGLHVLDGVDHSAAITIRHLLAQTSGLPDYFSGKGPDGRSLEKKLLAGQDRYWTAEEAVAMSKEMQPEFAPGTPGKAHYSDTNYQLLGIILQQITGRSFNTLIQERICRPLAMQSTYVYNDTADHKPVPLRYKKAELHIPMAMTSVTVDGGIVSTAEDMQVFLQAFHRGKLFKVEWLPEMMQWNPIFPPFDYGVGIMQFRLPGFYTLGRPTPALIGHSGLSGAFAFYSAEDNLYFTGTVNQLGKRGDSFKLIIRVIMQLRNDRSGA